MFDPWQSAWAYFDALAGAHAAPERWQAQRHERLVSLLNAATEGSYWWRERLGVLAPSLSTTELLRRIPPSSKGELMSNFSGWVTDPAFDLAELRRFAADRSRQAQAYRGRALVWESSGSRGEPGLFVQDARALAVSDALEAARGPGSLPGRNGLATALQAGARMAFVGAIDGPFASIVSLQRLRRLNPWVAATARAFSFLQPLATLVDALNDWRPAVLATYPSMAWVLAQERISGRLQVDVEAVWTGGETLTPAQRRAVGQAFGCPVRNSYGASECLPIAFECRCGALHLNADWVILEPVDAALRPVREGEAGFTTLLTNLANHLQPIIRYDLGDRVRFVPGLCACGGTLPVIEVEGRGDEVLTLADAAGRLVHLAPLALTTVLEDEAGVFDFQLVQHGACALRIALFGRERADRQSQRRAVEVLRAYLERQGLGAVAVTVRAAMGLERGRSGKLSRVWCEPPLARLSGASTRVLPTGGSKRVLRATRSGRAATRPKPARAPSGAAKRRAPR